MRGLMAQESEVLITLAIRSVKGLAGIMVERDGSAGLTLAAHDRVSAGHSLALVAVVVHGKGLQGCGALREGDGGSIELYAGRCRRSGAEGATPEPLVVVGTWGSEPSRV